MALRQTFAILIVGFGMAVTAGASAHLEAPAVEPAAAYKVHCSSCHNLERNGIGPNHRGIFGKKAGSVAGYSYSPALKNSGIVWDRETLDKWLQGPRKLVPGTKMVKSVANPATRKAIIDYLERSR
jgi:cytochrome c